MRYWIEKPDGKPLTNDLGEPYRLDTFAEAKLWVDTGERVRPGEPGEGTQDPRSI